VFPNRLSQRSPAKVGAIKSSEDFEPARSGSVAGFVGLQRNALAGTVAINRLLDGSVNA